MSEIDLSLYPIEFVSDNPNAIMEQDSQGARLVCRYCRRSDVQQDKKGRWLFVHREGCMATWPRHPEWAYKG